MNVLQTLNTQTNNVALIVIDKQYGYIERGEKEGGTLALETSLPRIDEFIKKMRVVGVTIIWTKMIENEVESPKNIQVKCLLDPGSLGRTYTRDKSFEIKGEQPLENERIINKLYYDAFADTDLNKELQQSNISTVIIVGGYTSRCILGTSYGANGHGYNVLVCKDLVANPDKFTDEADAALKIIDAIIGWTIPSEEILNFLNDNT